MAASNLGQILKFFEDSRNAVTLNSIARELDLTPARVESMIEYWVRKGRIRLVEDAKECGSCGIQGNCPFVIDLPRSYELVRDSDDGSLLAMIPACKQVG